MNTAREKRTAAMSAGAFFMLVGTLASAYIISQFLRNSVGVIAPNLAAELAISAAQIGVLSSSFFFAFAAAQLPLGVAIDRYGPKRSMLVCAVVVVIGTLMFATAKSSAGLIAARVLMGLGTSCYLMAPLALYARQFPPERFAFLAGLQLGLGTLGTLFATAPFAYAAALIGWRGVFGATALAMGIVGLLIATVVRQSAGESAAVQQRETLRESLAGVFAAMRMPSVGRLFLMHMATYSSFVVFVGLWGGPYLSHVYGFDLTARGSLLLIPAMTQALGLLVYGSADRFFRQYKVPVIIGALATATFLALLAVAGRLSPVALVVWLALFGLFTAFTPVVIAHGKSLFPERLVGRGMTLLNMGTMAGAFVAQTVSGVAIGLFPLADGVYPLAAYRLVFALQASFIVGAALIYLKARDPLRDANKI